MKTPAELAADYMALWNEREAPAAPSGSPRNGRRRRPMSTRWLASPAATEIAGLIGAVQAQYPDFRFRALGSADGHGEFVRFSWGFGPEGAEPVAKGTDFVRLEGGRIASVTGFLDLAPGAA